MPSRPCGPGPASPVAAGSPTTQARACGGWAKGTLRQLNRTYRFPTSSLPSSFVSRHRQIYARFQRTTRHASCGSTGPSRFRRLFTRRSPGPFDSRRTSDYRAARRRALRCAGRPDDPSAGRRDLPPAYSAHRPHSAPRQRPVFRMHCLPGPGPSRPGNRWQQRAAAESVPGRLWEGPSRRRPDPLHIHAIHSLGSGFRRCIAGRWNRQHGGKPPGHERSGQPPFEQDQRPARRADARLRLERGVHVCSGGCRLALLC